MRIKVKASELKPGDEWFLSRVTSVEKRMVDHGGSKPMTIVVVEFESSTAKYSGAYRPNQPFTIRRAE